MCWHCSRCCIKSVTRSLPWGAQTFEGVSKQWTISQVNIEFQETSMKKNKACDGEGGGDERGAAAVSEDGQ